MSLPGDLPEFSPQQIHILGRLFAAGFLPASIPAHQNALVLRKGDCAALLTPVKHGGFKLAAAPSYIVDGNFSVKLQRPGGDVFVWKKIEVTATVERLQELEIFRREISAIMEAVLA